MATTDNRRIIRNYYEQLYAINVHSLDKFLERHKSPTLIQGETKHPCIYKGTETVF